MSKERDPSTRKACSKCGAMNWPEQIGQKGVCRACIRAWIYGQSKNEVPKRLSDRRGRKDGRSVHKLSGDADMRDYNEEREEQ